MKILQYTALLALSLMTFIACHHHNSDNKNLFVSDAKLESANIKFSPSEKEEEKFSDTAASPGPTQTNPILQSNPKVKPDWEKKIIKTANLTLEVKDYNTFNNEFHKNVKQFGGYVAQEEQSQSAYQITNAVTIKVPVDQFDDAVAQLITGNKQLIEKKISTDDVTSEIVDTKSRMEAKKQVRERYLDLLKQAKNMNEILQVQKEINDIQEEIESATGRIGYLNHASIFSTIHLVFFQVIDATAKDIKDPSYFYQVKEAFRNGGRWAIEILIGALNIWPLLILILGVWFTFRKWKFAKVSNK